MPCSRAYVIVKTKASSLIVMWVNGSPCPKEQFPEAVHVLAAFDTVLDAPRERHIAYENGQSGVAPELSAEVEGADLSLAQWRPIANEAGRIGSVFGKPQLVALSKNLSGRTLAIIERVVLSDFDGRMRQFCIG